MSDILCLGVDTMNISSDNLEEQLNQMCINFISLLKALKLNGLITEEEYLEHTKIKYIFLEKKSLDYSIPLNNTKQTL